MKMLASNCGKDREGSQKDGWVARPHFGHLCLACYCCICTSRILRVESGERSYGTCCMILL